VRQLENAMFRAVVLAEGDIIGASEFPQVAVQIAQAPFAPPSSSELPHIMSAPAMVEIHHPHDGAATSGPHAMPGTLALVDSHGDVRPLEELEFETIRFAIAHYRGQMSEVARRLRIGRSTLYRKLEHLGLGEQSKEPA
jgi:DNA-binding NtrC family response regulator